MTNRENDIEVFYRILDDLEAILGGMRQLRDCHGRMQWPERGVYFFFEEGEMRKLHPQKLRVVRVGTHAVSSGSRATLWKRLSAHRGTKQGYGNHRGSIFRRHLGQALMNKSRGTITLPTWGEGQSAPRSVRESEKELERVVSEYIGRLPFLWVEVGDAPGPKSDRAVIEANAIILLAGNNGCSPLDPPGKAWLGHFSDRAKIRGSGLWNVDWVAEPANPLDYDPQFLRMLHNYVAAMRNNPYA